MPKNPRLQNLWNKSWTLIFGNNFIDIVKLTKSLLVCVLCIVNNEDKSVMGFLYQTIYKVRKEIVMRF